MPFSEIVIAAGSKALVACLSQYIKYKLKNDCIEKKIITSTSDTFLQYGSDSLIKKITSKLLPQKSLQEKTAIYDYVYSSFYSSYKIKESLSKRIRQQKLFLAFLEVNYNILIGLILFDNSADTEHFM